MEHFFVKAFEAEEERLDARLAEVAKTYDALENDSEDELNFLRHEKIKAMKQINLVQKHLVPCTTALSFYEAIKHNSHCIFHFWRKNQYCLELDSILLRLAKHSPSIKFLKVNVNDLPALALEYDLNVVPSLLIVVGQHVVHKMAGLDELGGTPLDIELAHHVLKKRLALAEDSDSLAYRQPVLDEF